MSVERRWKMLWEYAVKVIIILVRISMYALTTEVLLIDCISAMLPLLELCF